MLGGTFWWCSYLGINHISLSNSSSSVLDVCPGNWLVHQGRCGCSSFFGLQLVSYLGEWRFIHVSQAVTGRAQVTALRCNPSNRLSTPAFF